MKYNEAYDLIDTRFTSILRDKFLNSYPDTFVKSQTKDVDVYKNANHCMYSWYIGIINSAKKTHEFSPKYRQTDTEYLDSDWSCIKRLIDDFEQCENWQVFIFEHLPLQR